MTKRRGPRTEPWGNALVTFNHSEINSPRTTLCFLLFRKALHQSRICERNPYPLSFKHNLINETESKAFAKSKNIISISIPAAYALVMKSGAASKFEQQL
jgi:hypothetical protein